MDRLTDQAHIIIAARLETMLEPGAITIGAESYRFPPYYGTAQGQQSMKGETEKRC